MRGGTPPPEVLEETMAEHQWQEDAIVALAADDADRLLVALGAANADVETKVRPFGKTKTKKYYGGTVDRKGFELTPKLLSMHEHGDTILHLSAKNDKPNCTRALLTTNNKTPKASSRALNQRGKTPKASAKGRCVDVFKLIQALAGVDEGTQKALLESMAAMGEEAQAAFAQATQGLDAAAVAAMVKNMADMSADEQAEFVLATQVTLLDSGVSRLPHETTG